MVLTAGFCLTGEVVELTGDKEPEVAPDAQFQSSTHSKRMATVKCFIDIEGGEESRSDLWFS